MARRAEAAGTGTTSTANLLNTQTNVHSGDREDIYSQSSEQRHKIEQHSSKDRTYYIPIKLLLITIFGPQPIVPLVQRRRSLITVCPCAGGAGQRGVRAPPHAAGTASSGASSTATGSTAPARARPAGGSAPNCARTRAASSCRRRASARRVRRSGSRGPGRRYVLHASVTTAVTTVVTTAYVTWSRNVVVA